ncbi:MAG: hypothetical protein PVJ57_11755 [Phycisphaerae bacterium]|jgi:hypothetical protein
MQSETESTGTTPTEHPPIPADVRCPDCGYDLRGLTSMNCPECGLSLEVVRSRESQIPWVHRRHRGLLRAYCQTVGLVERRPRRFCFEMVRPVSFPDSQSFRWMTFLLAYVPLLLIGAVGCIAKCREGADVGPAMWLFAGSQVVTAAWLAGLPGLCSYAFHPRRLSIEQQNRAIALSYYAWAPLALMPLTLPFFLLAALTEPQASTNGLAFGLMVAGVCGVVGVLLLIVVACEVNLDIFTARLLHTTGGQRLRQFFWRNFLAGLFLVGLLGLCLGFVHGLVIWYSLH